MCKITWLAELNSRKMEILNNLNIQNCFSKALQINSINNVSLLINFSYWNLISSYHFEIGNSSGLSFRFYNFVKGFSVFYEVILKVQQISFFQYLQNDNLQNLNHFPELCASWQFTQYWSGFQIRMQSFLH